MANDGLIESLPRRSVIEVPCLMDRNGVQPLRMGPLPAVPAGVMHPHAVMHELAGEAVRTKSLSLPGQALQSDPLTAAPLTLPQIAALCDERCAENRASLAGWK